MVARRLINQYVSLRGAILHQMRYLMKVWGQYQAYKRGDLCWNLHLFNMYPKDQILIQYLHIKFSSSWDSNHSYGKSFSTLLLISKRAFWAPRVKLLVSLRKYAFVCRLHAKLQHFKIYLDTFEQIRPFEGKMQQFGLIHQVLGPHDRILQLTHMVFLKLFSGKLPFMK